MIEKFIKFIFILSCGGIMSTGYFYDINERIKLFGIDISLVIGLTYAISASLLLITIQHLRDDLTKNILYLLFICVILISPILWLNYGINDYGLRKYLSFSLIIVPISFLIIEKFSRRDIKILILVLFSVSVLLLILGWINFGERLSQQGQRMSVMGGGPIVFGRWLLIGALILFVYPRVRIKYKFILIPLFVFMAFSAGSRGPVYTFIIILTIYLLFTFKRTGFRSLIILFSFLFLFGAMKLFDNMGYPTLDMLEKVDELGNPTKRMKDPNIKSARVDRINRSIELSIENPQGVGIGNWAEQTNKLTPLGQHHPEKEYPHNIFLELFNESSLLSFLVFFILIVHLFVNAFNELIHRDDYLLKMSFLLLCFMLINTMISGDLSDSRLLFIFISIYISVRLLNNKKDKIDG